MELDQDLIKDIKRWSSSLIAEIGKCVSVGRKVYVIALSRKTPRFFEWLLRKKEEIPEVKALMDLVDSPEVELTTEYAIPLVFSGLGEADSNDVEGIVVDDAIIFGATANRVCMEWYGASGRRPAYSSIIRSDSGKLAADFISRDLDSEAPLLSFEGLRKPLLEVSRCILSSSLPVDMEFPILRIDMPYSRVREHMERTADQSWRRYEVQSDLIPDAPKAFTLMLDKNMPGNFGLDDGKVRIFDKNGKTAMEILAPHSLAVADICEGKVFDDEVYDGLMDAVRNSLSSANISPAISGGEYFISVLARYEARKKATLVVWTNYLLSLSAFVRNIGTLLPEGASVRIDERDVKLILGGMLASRLTPVLNKVISDRHTIKGVPDSMAALPIYKNPPEIYDTYLTEISGALSYDGDVNTNLDELFRVSYFSGSLYDTLRDKHVMGHHVIGETYDSLRIHLNRTHYNDADLEEKIHKWMDTRIDECRISPKYELVIGSDNREYYRRFFLCGSNAIDD